MPDEPEVICMTGMWEAVLSKAWKDWQRLHKYDRLRRRLTPTERTKRIKILHLTAGADDEELHPRDWLMTPWASEICEMLGREPKRMRQAVTDQAIRWQERIGPA